MSGFTPMHALVGGALIGAAAALLWLGLGRIAGISGIVGGLMTAARGDRIWRLAFLAGIMAAPVMYRLTGGTVPTGASGTGPALVIVGGLLVGVGTRLGGGCTSGHGVCGLARLSRRSATATAVFMAVAALTVFLHRHVLGG
ncbi:YeeE/YedE family protein [Nitrospirillum sp. BR 11164]|uniref:YeeE/YedE family protein n=1 Tax=Nitrospirillum sp. BR 11164 TaxID=3104324 RepID=UPI002AFFB184|nr:YeeE/YedE family protein [Nitrospirillum sp. BR 11164]MEA1651785.1 YeeE/YedE family protein [Nitrospirillum sp. BR 11164]